MQIAIATSIEKTIKTKTPSPFEKRQKIQHNFISSVAAALVDGCC
jgi:hypothetical protein